MKTKKFNLIVQGKVLEGFDKEEAKKSFQKLSRLAPARVDDLFHRGAAIRKRNLDEQQARLQYNLFLNKGIVCQLQEVQEGRKDDGPANVTDVAISGLNAVPDSTDSDEGVAGNNEADQRRVLPFVFFGKAGEFFRIWIVNLLLTIITLGFYFPWAKVRTNRYFYGNTRLDGVGFSYLANPVTILKGYFVAAVFLLLYVVSSMIHPVADLIMSLMVLALFPWVLVRSLRFKAYNSSYRNIRFEFKGPVAGAYRVFLLWPVLTLLSVGILFPHMIYKQKGYLFNNFCYGSTSFRFDETGGSFWRLYLIAFGLLIAVVAGAFLIGMTLPLLIAPYLLISYFLLFAFIVVRQTNIVYNAVGLAEHGFRSSYDMASWIKLQIGNTIGVLLSLGLLIPWARIRSARYRAQHTAFIAAGDLGQFVATEQKKRDAVGEEIGDLFDMDIAI